MGNFCPPRFCAAVKSVFTDREQETSIVSTDEIEKSSDEKTELYTGTVRSNGIASRIEAGRPLASSLGTLLQPFLHQRLVV